MEGEQKDVSSNTLASGAKRGRGRPPGSLNKKVISVKMVSHNVRASKRVDFFSPEMAIRPKVKKRGRPKKIKIPGRPRKIPLSPIEEAERVLRLSKKRKLLKPLGRPRIHPVVENTQKEKRSRGRPRKYECIGSQNGGTLKSVAITEVHGETPRRRGRPSGSFKKKRGPPAGVKRQIEGTPGKRGRPPGSGNKIQIKFDANGTPRKKGRPPVSERKLISVETNGTPRKRGRPPGSGTKLKLEKQVPDGGVPRKRGRPPGSVNKVKVLLPELNESPRKRGRPPGSGKLIKTLTAEHVITNSTVSVNAQPRKRGRPKKFFPDIQADGSKSAENEEPSLKRAYNSFSVKNLSKPDAEDRNDARGVLKLDSIVHGTEDGLNNALVQVHENSSRKCLSSRVAGKSPKKK